MSLVTQLKGTKDGLAVILAYAEKAGWQGRKTSGGHIQLFKPGHKKKITCSFSTGCHRGPKNCIAQLKREDRLIAQQQEQGRLENA